MASEKQSFVMYNEWRDLIQELSIEQRGVLLTAVFDLVNGTQLPEMDGMTKLCFMVFKAQIDRNAEKWREIRKKRREAGAKGGAAKQANQANAKFANQNAANVAVNANANVNANVNVNVNDYQSPQEPPKGADVFAERFERFWAAYPRKVGKGAAANAFKKIKPSEELVQKMLDAITAQNQSDQWKKDGGQYIPNPATWLNQSRWEDETARTAEKDISLNDFFKEVPGWKH